MEEELTQHSTPADADCMQAGAVLAPTFAMAEGPEKTKARQDLMKPGGNLHNKLSVVEKLLAMSTSKYYVGDKPGAVSCNCDVGW